MDVRVLGPFNLGGGDEDERPPLPQPDAAAMTLGERYKELWRRHELRDGQIVIYKAGFDPRPEYGQGQPMLFLDDSLDGYDRGDLRIKVGRADAVVMVLDRDGKGVIIAVDRRYLEPWPRAGAGAGGG